MNQPIAPPVDCQVAAPNVLAMLLRIGERSLRNIHAAVYDAIRYALRV